MNGLQLIATGGALPGRTVTNEELSRTVDTSDEWITTRTGAGAQRPWAAGHRLLCLRHPFGP